MTRICSFNLEWMNDWFTADAEAADWVPTFTRDGQTSNTAVTAGRAANVIRAIDPDVLAIQEGPSRLAELELFVRDYLGDAYKAFLGDTGGSQKIGLLVKHTAVDSAKLAPGGSISGLIEQWETDFDGDAVLDLYSFTRTPLVVDLVVKGRPLQVIVAHTKSNFVNNGRELWNDPAQRQNYIVAALKNRRRISAEGMRIRKYLDARLAQNRNADIIVLGDLNDGPGLDYFEERYITHNVTDIIIGSAFEPEWVFEHAQHDEPREQRYTAVFDDFVTGENDRRVLLDHILMSPGLGRRTALRKVPGSGRVCHKEFDAEVVAGGVRRQNRPSDHRPVAVDLVSD